MRNHKFFILIIFALNIGYSNPCSVDYQVCRKRSVFIYQLNMVLESLEKSCSIQPRVVVKWESFLKVLGGNDTYGANDCLLPLKFFVEFCDVNPTQAKSVLSTISNFECLASEKGSQSISFKNKTVSFRSDPTNDYNSDRKGPSSADYVMKEMKSIFNLPVISQKDKQDFEEQKSETNTKNQVDAAHAKAKIKTAKYQEESKRLTEWFQKEMQSVQNSKLPADERSKKMQELSSKYSSDLNKVIKEFTEAK